MMTNMITGHIEGIISLLKTANIVMLDGLLGTGFINVDEICIALKQYIVKDLHKCELDLIVALLDRFDVTDKEIIDRMACSFSAWDKRKHVWDEKMARTFAKLMACGAKITNLQMISLPYDAFAMYTAENDYVICDEVLFALSHTKINPKIVDTLHEKLRQNIESISQASFFAFVISMIRFDKHTDLILQEVRRRQLFDTVFAFLTPISRQQSWLCLFDECGSECENIDVYIFFQRCLARHYRRNDQTYLEENDLVEIDIMFRTNPGVTDMFESIKNMSLEITVENALDSLTKIKELMATYIAR